MSDAPIDLIENLQNIKIGLSKQTFLELLKYSLAWGYGPSNELKQRDLNVIANLISWVKSKSGDEIFFECLDADAEEPPLNVLLLDEYINETF